MENKTLAVDIKDLGQFLISECRYGYTRNNHLMPDGAYDHVKEYLPKIAEQDKAIHVAKQLCEECISNQLITNFYDGEDDEFGNRKKAIEFIVWCIDYVNALEKYWRPYNFEQVKENRDKDFEPRYNIYEIIKGEKVLITEEPLSEHDYLNFILNYAGGKDITYRKETIKVTEDFNDRRRHYIYHIIEPEQRDFYIEHI